MSFFSEGLSQAWDLIIDGNPYLYHLIVVTLKVAGVSTLVATVLGLPLGLALGLGRFPGRGALQSLANAGLALPPVVVGIVLTLLFFPRAPLGRFNLLFTLNGVYIAQSILAFPVVVALTSSAVSSVTPGLLEQARAYGAGRVQVALLATRESRIGIVAAIIAGAGTALSEVAAVVLVGGNTYGYDQTLGSAALDRIGAGYFAYGLAIGIVLMAMIIVINVALTILQRASGVSLRLRSWS